MKLEHSLGFETQKLITNHIFREEFSTRSLNGCKREENESSFKQHGSERIFPHRTIPFSSNNNSRRNSEDISTHLTFSSLMSKNNLLVRSNPIGLAEPKLKHDGLTEGSSAGNSSNINRSGSTPPESNWKERRSSWTTISSIGHGRGLIETGKPSNNLWGPFGATKGALTSFLRKRPELSGHLARNKERNKGHYFDKDDIQTFTIPRHERSRSVTRKLVTTLPDEILTISLPSSRIGSRYSSVEPPDLKALRSSSVELFQADYDIRVSSKQIPTVKTRSTNHIVLRGDEVEAQHSFSNMVEREANALSKALASLIDNNTETENSELSSQDSCSSDSFTKLEIKKTLLISEPINLEKSQIPISSSLMSMNQDQVSVSLLEVTQDKQKCGRCHELDHETRNCSHFSGLHCPRCLEWNHWLDNCSHSNSICSQCSTIGHSSIVHSVSQNRQRQIIVECLGWESFKHWFYEPLFRSWWQLNGLLGIPLYKIYERNTEWKLTPSSLEDLQSMEGKLCSSLSQKADSLEDLLKSVTMSRRRINVYNDEDEDENKKNSGNSTPEHLKIYSGKLNEDESNSRNSRRKIRTFSETIKLLDEDIVAELNLK